MGLASEIGTSSTLPPRQALLVPHQWADALHAIAKTSQTPPISVICGPKNSGKSTFSRLLLNSLLERYDRVGYLDADVGQPEFFLPGCLSLHLVDECLPDLLSTSMREPERCFFFGDISSKRDPQAYINSICRLYDYFLENFHQSNDHGCHRTSLLPLIINTPGWVKGTGFDVLVELLRYVSPTHVVQIRISVESKNLPTGAFWLINKRKGPSELIEVTTVFTNSFNQTVLIRKNAHSLRDLRLSNYFKQCFPSSLNICTNKELAHALASIPPYQVHFSQVKVTHLHCQVPKHEVFHSLNATIVGLAVSSTGSSSTECTPWCVGLDGEELIPLNGNNSRLVNEVVSDRIASVNPCNAGIVRGIDAKKGMLYVITPVSPCKLEKVDILFQGFIEIPTSLLQVRGCVSPYMSTNVLHKLPAKEL